MRRFIDVSVSAVALLILCPLLIIVAIAVIIESPGNPFYLGPRAGRFGKNFNMWKFRTMVRDASRMGPITGPKDKRVTRLGRILRKTKIDELPQFINVLIGDMTLVGPRPESPDLVQLYTAQQRAVLTAKPGVTGRVQLIADDESETIPKGVDARQYYIEHLMGPKLALDLDYLSHRTPLSDARILLGTAGLVMRVLIRRGGTSAHG